MGKAFWALARMRVVPPPKSSCWRTTAGRSGQSEGDDAGMMKRKTGRSLKKPAAWPPPRHLFVGSVEDALDDDWSVHRYHKPMMGAQKSMPIQGSCR
jgi:protein gp37